MSLKTLLLSVIGIAVTAAIVATAVDQRSSSNILIPTLNFSRAAVQGSTLLGATVNGIQLNEYTREQSIAGALIHKDEHNLVSCPIGTAANIPVINPSLAPASANVLFWGYQYSGRENANYAAGKTKLALFDGTFFLSQAQVNAPNLTQDERTLYTDINRLTQFNTTGSGKQLYVMSAIDLCFICGQGLLPANACPTGASSSSSSSSSSVSSSSSISSSSSSSSSCQSNSQCANGQVCISGTCSACTLTTQCPAGQACVSGTCGACTTNSQCANGQVCSNGQCVNGCGTNPPCASNQSCIAGTCQNNCGTNPPCTAGSTCVNDQCIANCGTNPPCPAGQGCLNNQCVNNCGTNPPCGSGTTCTNGQCVGNCGTNPPCSTGQTCQNGQCVNNCGNNPPCSTTQTCVSGSCVANCGNNPPCAAGQTCFNGQCLNNCGNGPPCSSNQTCINNTCQNNCGNNPPCSSDRLCVSGSCVATCQTLPSPCDAGQTCTDSAQGAVCSNSCFNDATLCASTELCELTSGRYECIDCNERNFCTANQICSFNQSNQRWFCQTQSSSSSSQVPTIFLHIDYPITNVVTGYPIEVQYHVTGSNPNADHVHLQLDNNTEIRGIPLNGRYSFSGTILSGQHTITGYVATASHSEIFGSRTSVTFQSTGGSNSSIPASPNGVFLGGPFCGNLFWTNSRSDKIQNNRLDGTPPVSTVLVPGQNHPNRILLDTTQKKMYWVEHSPIPDRTPVVEEYRVMKSNYDGTNKQRVLPNVITMWTGSTVPLRLLAVDGVNQRLYWGFEGTTTTSIYHTIYSVNMNGTDKVQVRYFAGGYLPANITVDAANDSIYYSTYGTVSKTNLAGQYLYPSLYSTGCGSSYCLLGLTADTRPNDPLNNKVYWVDRDERALMIANAPDFTSPTALLQNLPASIEAATIDVKNKVVYFATNTGTAGAPAFLIQRVNFDGGPIRYNDVFRDLGGIDPQWEGHGNAALALDVAQPGLCSTTSSSSSSVSSSSSSSSQGAVCGNGTVEVGEQCDDGNTVDGDACFSNCRWVVPPNPLPDLVSAFFKFVYPPNLVDQFIIQLTNPTLIAEARSLLAGTSPTPLQKHIMGVIVPSPAPYNPDWHYHLNPSSISFFSYTVEVCDAGMKLIEDHLDEVGGAFLPQNRWCPWGSELVAEVQP